jgi:hypothetical protein
MKNKFIVPILIIFTLALNSTLSFAGQTGAPNRQWADVQATSTGNKLSLRLKDGKKMEGRLVNISDTALTIDRGSKSTDVTRDSIEKVYRIEPKSRGKSIAKGALIGAGIGFGAGAGVGIAAGNYEDLETAELVGILGGIGAAIGAGLGALFSSFGKKEQKVLIYESK